MSLDSDSYDVCIVGASIAGNYLTHLLSKSNWNYLSKIKSIN